MVRIVENSRTLREKNNLIPFYTHTRTYIFNVPLQIFLFVHYSYSRICIIRKMQFTHIYVCVCCSNSKLKPISHLNKSNDVAVCLFIFHFNARYVCVCLYICITIFFMLLLFYFIFLTLFFIYLYHNYTQKLYNLNALLAFLYSFFFTNIHTDTQTHKIFFVMQKIDEKKMHFCILQIPATNNKLPFHLRV